MNKLLGSVLRILFHLFDKYNTHTLSHIRKMCMIKLITNLDTIIL